MNNIDDETEINAANHLEYLDLEQSMAQFSISTNSQATSTAGARPKTCIKPSTR